MVKDLVFTNGRTLKPGTMFCIGSNYAKHAREMGGEVPDTPTVFLKPPQAIIHNGEVIKLPSLSIHVHHEVELIVVIGKECMCVQKEEAHEYIAGYGVGIDVTMRDVQNEAKKNGKPWAIAKGFYTSAPVSEIIPAEQFPEYVPVFELSLSVNDKVRQRELTSAMERNVSSLIEFLSKVFTLLPGDIIFTGTPQGVGELLAGDKIHAKLKTVADSKVQVAEGSDFRNFVSLDIDVK